MASGSFETILEAVGKTPLVRLNKIPKEHGIKANIYVKLEYLSAGGSAQDRLAKRLIELAESRGLIQKDTTLIYSASHNVALGMALVCAVKGYRLIIVTPEREERDIDTMLTALGAEVLRVNNGSVCSKGYAKSLNLPNSFLLNTLEKEAAAEIIAYNSADEIFSALNKVSMVVVPHGQGGSSIAQKAPSGTRVVSVTTLPDHKGGNGLERYPFLELDGKQEKSDVSSKEAFLMARRLIREEGVMTGPAGGAGVTAALQLATNFTENDNVVVVLGDGIRNYMNKFVDDQWLKERGVILDSVKPTVHPEEKYDPEVVKKYTPTTLAGYWSRDVDGKFTNCSNKFKAFREVRPAVLDNVLEAIGNTPLVKLQRIPKMYGVNCNIYAKCEYFNAGGSIKDRIAVRMIELAEENGLLKPGMTIIEPTSGNTGIGLSLAAAVKGYKCIIVMPVKMSKEKALAMEALGAIIVRTPNEAAFDSPLSHIGVALRLQNEIPGAIILDQYRNMGNPLVHYEQTAEEMIHQSGGKIDAVVVGAGTGGSVTGVGMKIKDALPNCKVIGTDPIGSILADPSQTWTKFYEVEGVGYDFIPGTLKRDVVDTWIKTGDKDSFEVGRALIQKEGLLCGGSSGANVWAALQVAKDMPEGSNIVVVLPDGVRNYLSKFLDDEWLAIRDLIPDKKMCC
ncbi:unnamed protein product, partial [Mesorhabditis belari]|uniref:cystathionine beta-synthase n=1 Tax=Mesorhabditis belari TaxID=2138241 RepID=A0AAF3EHA0_9BILA